MVTCINGKEYDTETAMLIGEWCNGFQRENFVYKALYKDSEGNFFEYAEGGSWTEYAQKHHGRILPGWRITERSVAEAEAFLHQAGCGVVFDALCNMTEKTENAMDLNNSS